MIKTKTIFCLLKAHHLFTLLPWRLEGFTSRFNLRCQMLTLLLNCTCMMVSH